MTMTMRTGFLQSDFDLTANLRVESDRLLLIPGTSALSDAEQEGGVSLSRLLAARIPQSWPPEIVEDPSDSGSWWRWYFVARDADEPVLIGVGALKGWPAVDGSLQVGCSFVPEFRDHGYGTEAVAALTRWTLEQPGVKRVFAEICLENKGAHDVLKNVGFVMVGPGSDETLIRFKYD